MLDPRHRENPSRYREEGNDAFSAVVAAFVQLLLNIASCLVNYQLEREKYQEKRSCRRNE